MSKVSSSQDYQRWLVGVDKSRYAESAFYMALKTMNREKDHLYLVHVIPQVEGFLSALSSKKEIEKIRNKQNEESTQILARYHLAAIENGVKNVFLLNVTANHVGESLCEICKTKNIDNLVIGRRSLNKVKRLFIGSTSDYCIRHATCNVIISRETLPTEKGEGHHVAAKAPQYGEKETETRTTEIGDIFSGRKEYTQQELGNYQIENVIFDF